MTMNIVMLIASQGFQEIEYAHTKQALIKEGAHITVVSDRKGKATSHLGTFVSVDGDIASIDLAKYDAVVIVGGPGAWDHLNIPVVHTIVKNAAQQKKIVAAICISPRILAVAGVLKGKRATGWDADHALEKVFKQYDVSYEKKPVVVDDLFVTAAGPDAATDFGDTIIRVLRDRAQKS